MGYSGVMIDESATNLSTVAMDETSWLAVWRKLPDGELRSKVAKAAADSTHSRRKLWDADFTFHEAGVLRDLAQVAACEITVTDHPS